MVVVPWKGGEQNEGPSPVIGIKAVLSFLGMTVTWLRKRIKVGLRDQEISDAEIYQNLDCKGGETEAQ